MLIRSIISSVVRPIGLSFHYTHFRSRNRSYCVFREMGQEVLLSRTKRHANFRLSNVSSFVTELLEIHADEPTLHVVFIPGNPGVVAFYKDLVESLYELLGGSVSLTAVGHISHTMKNWEHGRLFSLQEQIDHKVELIKQELQNNEVPIVLVGHSIGAYISIETFKGIPEKVLYCIGLYPFLALNPQSRNQSIIGKIAKSPIVCVALSSIAALVGLLPLWALRVILRKSLSKTWSNSAVEAGCSHLGKYHTVRNILFMAMTEFEKISRQVPDIALSIEREGHTHAFCCTEAGSTWVAHHVASLINNQISRSIH
ncbi:lipid droplet-associated hydrolase isoform X3 [Morus notabilis]|uniref:lipid droplet-associated hydrolase isoform X3 n=1 Tax=Morus notabilis TaxID=981085 RepID=UPI000CED1854|nr:lipid droplet-associated hydrolase isoform X3 [Morus notabilis]